MDRALISRLSFISATLIDNVNYGQYACCGRDYTKAFGSKPCQNDSCTAQY